LALDIHNCFNDFASTSGLPGADELLFIVGTYSRNLVQVASSRFTVCGYMMYVECIPDMVAWPTTGWEEIWCK